MLALLLDSPYSLISDWGWTITTLIISSHSNVPYIAPTSDFHLYSRLGLSSPYVRSEGKNKYCITTLDDCYEYYDCATAFIIIILLPIWLV